ncbi:MAG: hypothetical protein ACMUHY_07630 [Thermoplasmatota archaeon]
MAKRSKAKEEKTVEPGPLDDIFTGELKSRHYGIRIDDDLEVLVIAGNELIKIRGRLLSMKDDLEVLGEDGLYQKIIMDWVVGIKVLKHNRPAPEKDNELVRKTPRTKPKKASVDHAYN